MLGRKERPGVRDLRGLGSMPRQRVPNTTMVLP